MDQGLRLHVHYTLTTKVIINIMEDRIKILLRERFNKDNEKYLDKAISLINANSELERKITNHYLDIEEEELFSENIEKSIKLLTELKEKGYTSISQHWNSYDANYFLADKYELETDDEYVDRLYHIINKEINRLIEIEKEEDKKEIERERLEWRLR